MRTSLHYFTYYIECKTGRVPDSEWHWRRSNIPDEFDSHTGKCEKQRNGCRDGDKKLFEIIWWHCWPSSLHSNLEQHFQVSVSTWCILNNIYWLKDNHVRIELSSIMSSEQISSVLSDPTQISSSSLGLTEAQQKAAILAYSKSSSSPIGSLELLLINWCPEAHGVRNIYYFMIPCCCISFFLTLFFVKGTSLKREDDQKLQEEGKQWAAQHRTRDRLRFNKNRG